MWRSRTSALIPAAAVSDVARPCRLDGHIATRRGYVPVLVRSRTREACENGRDRRPKLLVNALASETRSWPTRTLTWLLLRALPLKERATVVDTVSIPTLSPPRSPIRARDEMCLLILGAQNKTARCTCEPAVACKELRGVCRLIDLVSSSSIDATNCLFTESDALRSRKISVPPLSEKAQHRSAPLTQPRHRDTSRVSP
jgi:hypothetical protein